MSILKTKSLNIYLGLALVTFLLSCTSFVRDETGVPAEVVTYGSRYIIEKVGQSYFNEHFVYLPEYSFDISPRGHRGGWYRICWQYNVTDKPGMNSRVNLIVSSAGYRLDRGDIDGVPDCIMDISRCEYSVDKTRALEIALASGFDDGVDEWNLDFVWMSRKECYVWRFTKTKWICGVYRNKDVLAIDARNGEIYETD